MPLRPRGSGDPLTCSRSYISTQKAADTAQVNRQFLWGAGVELSPRPASLMGNPFQGHVEAVLVI